MWEGGALARFSASEPCLFKRAPVVLITLSLGTLTLTDAVAHIRECTAALVDTREGALACTQLPALMMSYRAGHQFVIVCLGSRPVPCQPLGLKGRYHGDGSNDARRG